MKKRTKELTFTAFCAGLGITFEAGQLATFRVLFDGVEPSALEGVQREQAYDAFGDVDEVPPIARDVVVLVKGARVMGTRGSMLRGLHLGLTLPAPTAPGEDIFVLVCGPDTRLSRQALGYAIGEIERTPSLRRRVIGEITRDAVTLRRDDGRHVRLESLPATRGGSALRGRSLAAVVFTEFAFVRDSNFVVNDDELFKAVRPRLLPGGQVIIESTPWLESGLLYTLHRDNFGDPKTALVAFAPTTFMRSDPRVLAVVASEYLRAPDDAPHEFGGQFRTGGASEFFDGVSSARAVDKDRPLVIAARPGASIGMGGDIALTSDSSALAGVDHLGGIFHLLFLEELRPKKGEPLKLSAVVAHFAGAMKPYGVKELLADGHVREPAREFAEAHKLRIISAPEGNSGKTAVYVKAQQAFKEGRVRLPNHPRLLAQLRSIVATPMSGGGMKISAPRRAGSGHGDLVSALVLAMFAAEIGQGASHSRGEITTCSFEDRPIFPLHGYGSGDSTEHNYDSGGINPPRWY